MASQLPTLPGQQPQQDQVPQVCTGGSGGRSHPVLPPNQELPVFMTQSFQAPGAVTNVKNSKFSCQFLNLNLWQSLI